MSATVLDTVLTATRYIKQTVTLNLWQNIATADGVAQSYCHRKEKKMDNCVVCFRGCWQCAKFEQCLANQGCINGVVKERAHNVFFIGTDCFEEDNDE